MRTLEAPICGRQGTSWLHPRVSFFVWIWVILRCVQRVAGGVYAFPLLTFALEVLMKSVICVATNMMRRTWLSKHAQQCFHKRRRAGSLLCRSLLLSFAITSGKLIKAPTRIDEYLQYVHTSRFFSFRLMFSWFPVRFFSFVGTFVSNRRWTLFFTLSDAKRIWFIMAGSSLFCFCRLTVFAKRVACYCANANTVFVAAYEPPVRNVRGKSWWRKIQLQHRPLGSETTALLVSELEQSLAGNRHRRREAEFIIHKKCFPLGFLLASGNAYEWWTLKLVLLVGWQKQY